MADFCLAFFYADLGNAWWKTACTEMLRSARRVMPDARIVQLSPKGTAMHPWASELVEANLGDPAPDVAPILSKVKGYLMAEFAKASPQQVVFCDADVIWIAKPPLYQIGAIALDETAEELPYRQFYVQSGDPKDPINLEWLTRRLTALLDALPPSTWARDACELALNHSIKTTHGEPVAMWAKDTQKYLVHFPGAPEEMIAFARSLDGGEEFKAMDPGYVPPRKEGLSQQMDQIIFFDLKEPLTIPSAGELMRANAWVEDVAECPACKESLGADGVCGNLVCQDYKRRDETRRIEGAEAV